MSLPLSPSAPCILCGQPVVDGEAFLTALVQERGELEHRPFHLGCHQRSIAAGVCQQLKYSEPQRRSDDSDDDSERDDFAEIVAAMIARLG